MVLCIISLRLQSQFPKIPKKVINRTFRPHSVRSNPTAIHMFRNLVAMPFMSALIPSVDPPDKVAWELIISVEVEHLAFALLT